MKRSNWVRLLAVILVISLMVGPVSAVTFRSGEGNRQNALVGSLIGRIRDIVRDIIDDWFDQPFPGKPISPKPTTPVDPSEPVDDTDPTGPVDSTDPTDPEDPESTNSGLELVEGYSNTENGQLLRGHTYKLSEVISQQKPQNPISHIGLRKPISILPGNPIGGLRINAVTTTATEDEITVPDGLVAYYDFESVSGTTVSNVVTTNTTTTAELKDDASIVDTEFMGKAMKLNGGALQLSDVINATESSFSVSMWYKFDANHATSNNNINMIQAGTIGGSTGRTILIMRSNSKFYSYLCGANTADTNTSVIRSQWQHITFSYDKDAGKVYFYINGTADNADGISISGQGAHDTADMIIGRHRTEDAGRIYGFVDEVRVYNKALTAAEAAAIYKHNNENYEFTNWVDGGQYYIQNARAHFNNANSWLRAENNEIVGTDKANATLFTLDILDNGKYTLSYDDNGTTKYLYLKTSNGNATADEVSTSVQELTLAHVYTGNVHGVVDDGHFIRIGSNGKYLGQYGGVAVLNYGAEASATDSGIAMWFHLVKDGTESKVEHIAADDSRDIPLSVLSATAGSAHDGEGPDKTLDTDTSSIWHTEYNDSDRNNHWITFALSDDYKVDGLRYLPRQSGSNGIITGYKIEVSTDGQNYRTVETGTWADNADWKFAEFDAEHVRYVRLSATNAHGNYASAASIRLTGEKYNGPAEPEEPEEPTIPEDSYAVYFPVTMFNYTEATINAATDAKDPDGTAVRDGLYFTGGSPEYTKTTTTDLSAFVAGQYYIQNVRASSNNVASWLQAHSDNKIYGVEKSAATVWTLVIEDATYYLTCDINGETNYMKVGTNGDTDGYTTDKTPVTLSGVNGNANAVKIGNGRYYLCQWGSDTAQDYGGYGDNADDPGNPMLFYPVDSDTPIAPGKTETKITSGYQEWNRWDKASGNNSNGDLFYTGLVEKELVKDQLVFTVPDGGIFNNDTTVKDIYNFVGMPFLLNTTTGVYSFDSENNGAYFAGEPQSGTATEPHNLRFAYGSPQPMPDDVDVGDNSKNAFLPFNNKWTPLEDGDGHYGDWIDYHFGMRADLPFSMTPNGCVKSTDDKSEHITFTFSGDDDAWIFIDGKLVADLGGIHNRLDVTLDFAANTVTYSEENSQDGNNNTGSYNDPTFATTQKLFNEGGETGLLGMTRVEFASDESHEMQFFYLERGKGTSNCRIEFNLPMRDTVMVTKDITKSWSEEQDANDGDRDGTAPLTANEQAAVNKLDFYFKLWKKDANGEMTVVANTNYFLQEKATGKVLGTFTTGADGKFALKNGQTAKFMTDISNKGVTYYVEELDLDLTTFLTPDYNYAGLATKGFDYTGVALDPDSDVENATKEVSDHVSDASKIPEHELPMNATVLKSYDVTAYGSIESIDSLEFICTNYLNAELPNPTARAYEDIIVIDYGLPVQIDPLANDVYRGDALRILYWGDENLTLESYKEAEQNGTLTAPKTEYHSGTLQFIPGVQNEEGVVRDTFSYTLNKQLTKVEVITYIIESASYDNDGRIVTEYSVGKIYIVPATIMYYEENFANMITFQGSGWSAASDPQNISNAANISPFQEPGVVGTVDDSTYGSDVAYLSDDGDSNGTYRFGNTTNGAIRFSYTFTGTGTTIFARTSAKTGYMQVKVYAIDKDGKETLQSLTYRDTYWKDQNGNNLDENNPDGTGTLYNIPVFSEEFQHYGTYKVVCTVAKAGTKTEGNPDTGAGNEFYLDGIRVMQPLDGVFAIDTSGKDYQIPVDQMDPLTAKGVGAYKTDGESNLEVATLRQKLITDAQAGGTDWSKENFAVLTDTNGNIVTASEYISIGPKEEVYLSDDNGKTNAQTVSFSLETWKPEGLKLYMGMKAPFGHAIVNVGDHAIELENAPDCYYDVTNFGSVTEKKNEDGTTSHIITFTFEAAESIVSLTNIKIVGSYQIHLPEDTDILVVGYEGGN